MHIFFSHTLQFHFNFFLVFCIPQRVIMAVMCFLAIAIAYVMRVCLSTAITEMVKKIEHNEMDVSVCPADPSSNSSSVSSVNRRKQCAWLTVPIEMCK